SRSTTEEILPIILHTATPRGTIQGRNSSQTTSDTAKDSVKAVEPVNARHDEGNADDVKPGHVPRHNENSAA
ncbi:hypothetical protein JZU56_03460, partial [bacterium]|nr:hypothetical protein [bacterium]